MSIRNMLVSDYSTLEKIHGDSKFDYAFPVLDDPLFIIKKTVEEDGKVVQGLLVKLQGEVYLFVDSTWGTPAQRWERLKELTDAAKQAGWEQGLDQLICVVPPEIADSFEKRLKQIGMERNLGWPRFSFDLRQYVPKIRVESEVQAT